MNDNLIDVQTLKPFTRFIYTIGELPSSYLMSMTYEEQLVWLCNYLEKIVIPTVNNNGLAVEELQAKYIELKSYVEHYFDNLDVQEEINNKLDDLVRDGTLESLIGAYIQPRINAQNEYLQQQISIQNSLISDEFSEQNTLINQINTRVTNLTSSAPIPVSDLSDMTDTSKIYLYITDGYWYYYDGDSWEQGGLYQTSGITDGYITPPKTNFYNNLNNQYNNLINYYTNKAGVVIDNTGEEASNGNYYSTDFIPVTEGQSYSMIRFDGNSPVVINNITYLALYDENKTFISRATSNPIFTIPEIDETPVHYIRMSSNNNAIFRNNDIMLIQSNVRPTFFSEYYTIDDSHLTNNKELYNYLTNENKIENYVNDDMLSTNLLKDIVIGWSITTSTMNIATNSARACTLKPNKLASDINIYSTDTNLQFAVVTSHDEVLNSESLISDSGWKTTWTIPKNTWFFIQIRTLDNTTPTKASILSGIKCYGWNSQLQDLIDLRALNTIKNENMFSGKQKFVLHRGAQDEAPENTVPAFIIAGQSGVWGCETDVYETADGHFVCIHDSTVDRTTNGTGNVVNFTLAELEALTIDEGAHIELYPDLRIPTFEQFLQICKRYDMIPQIELKNITHYGNLIQIIKDMGFINKCYFAGTIGQFNNVRQVDTKAIIPFGIIMYTGQNYTSLVNSYKTLKNVMFNIQWDANVTSSLIHTIHDNNIAIDGWLGNSQQACEDMFDAGIDIITSNWITHLDVD